MTGEFKVLISVALVLLLLGLWKNVRNVWRGVYVKECTIFAVLQIITLIWIAIKIKKGF